MARLFYMKQTEDDGTPLRDKENPEESLRDRNVVGLQVMNGFKYDGDNVWNDGIFLRCIKRQRGRAGFYSSE